MAAREAESDSDSLLRASWEFSGESLDAEFRGVLSEEEAKVRSSGLFDRLGCSKTRGKEEEIGSGGSRGVRA